MATGNGHLDHRPKPNDKEASNKMAGSRSTTYTWKEIPSWMQDNHYIHTGYRAPSNSFSASISSIFDLHNESVNIWTHLLGSIVAFITGGVLYTLGRPRYPLATHEDVAVFACFFAGATACLGMSAAYHTLTNHSERIVKLGNQLDYAGIVGLIWGSFVPSVFYGFGGSNEPEMGLRKRYWGMITTISAGTFTLILSPKFRSPAWRPFRAFMFVAMGLSAIFPVLHGLSLYGVEQLERRIGLSWLVLQGVLYIVGASIYAARIPERWRPVVFDLWGNSHQIFHVLVLLAAAAHFVGLLKAFDHAHGYRNEGFLGDKSLL